MKFWLMKSEPDECSIDDVLRAPGRITPWSGVRNYQARNFMRDEMRPGDVVLYYHSSIAEPAVVGIAKVASQPYPDPTQFDPADEYYDPKATPEEPRWHLVDFEPVEALARPVTLAEMKQDPQLEGMRLLQRGNRLSVMPIEPEHFARIVELSRT